jgi:hypothetical protein
MTAGVPSASNPSPICPSIKDKVISNVLSYTMGLDNMIVVETLSKDQPWLVV